MGIQDAYCFFSVYLFLFIIVRLSFNYLGELTEFGAIAVRLKASVLYLVYSLFRKGLTLIRDRQRSAQLDSQETIYRLGKSIFWGGGELPAKAATTHFLVAGTTGAAKTLLLSKLIESVLPIISKRRALRC